MEECALEFGGKKDEQSWSLLVEIIRITSKTLESPDSVTSFSPPPPTPSPVIQRGQLAMPWLLHGYGKPSLLSFSGALKEQKCRYLICVFPVYQ